MKQLMMVTALALSGCVAAQDDSPVQFSSALALSGAPGGQCTVNADQAISRGRLNLAGGGNYSMAMQVRSSVPPSRFVTVGGSNVSVGGEAVTLSEYVYRYEAPAFLGLPTEETVAVYSVIQPGATGGYVFVNAFGPQALAKLTASGQLSDTPVGIIPTIKARGRLGTSAIETNEFSFPLSVVNATVVCPPGQTLNSICNAGQDFYCGAAATP